MFTAALFGRRNRWSEEPAGKRPPAMRFLDEKVEDDCRQKN
jgi:hypothetical protein